MAELRGSEGTLRLPLPVPRCSALQSPSWRRSCSPGSWDPTTLGSWWDPRAAQPEAQSEPPSPQEHAELWACSEPAGSAVWPLYVFSFSSLSPGPVGLVSVLVAKMMGAAAVVITGKSF